VFVGGRSREVYRENVEDIRLKAAALGRDAGDIKAFASAVIIAGKDDESAWRKVEEFKRLTRAEGYLAHAGGGGIDLAAYPREALIADILRAEAKPGRDNEQTGRRFYAPDATVGDALDDATRFDSGPFVAIGSPTTIADAIEVWVDETGLDGFNLRQFLTPGTLEDFVEFVVPELQRRGLYREEYEQATFREQLFGAGHARISDTHPAAQYRGGRNL
jgi:alkanesulfonate monooxygenase SsuD/methylene tetrahydromethanopterin reductase-like flavin-dependent oxidoreductase (luciferase family)